MTGRGRRSRPCLSAAPVLAAGAFAVLGGAAGCGGKLRPAADPVRIAVHSEPVSLDPHFHNEVLTFAILGNVFEAPTAFDPEMKLVPGLASSWENPDDRRWRLHLKPGRKFHDGRPVEAADVVESIRRARKNDLSQLKGLLVQVESESAVNGGTLEITTRRTYAPLLNKLALVGVVPRNSPSRIVDPVGSGPYRIAGREKGVVRLTPVPGESASGLLPLSFQADPDRASRLAGLLEGRTDLAVDIAPAEVDRVQEAACCRVEARPSLSVEFLQFGVKDPRFRDLRVRRAVHLALDRPLLVRAMFRGFALPASQLVGPGVFGFDPGIPVATRDVDGARRLLAEAGFPGGMDVTLEFREGRSGEEIARQLGEAGFRVKTVRRRWLDIYPRLQEQEISFYYGGVSAMSGDASDVLDAFVHSREQGYGLSNFGGYSTPALDRLIEEAGSTLGMAERLALLQRCMRAATDDLYLVPLVTPFDLYGVRKELAWKPRIDKRLLGREMRRGS